MDLVLSSMLEGRDPVRARRPDGVREPGRGATSRAAPALGLDAPAARDPGVRPARVGTAAARERRRRGRVAHALAPRVGGPRRGGRHGAARRAGRDRGQALDAIRRDFVANASHELKTPAASIQAAAETILTASLDDPEVIPRFASQLEREAVRLSRIVSDLLDLSRLESGSELDEAVAFDAVLRDEAERFEEPAAEAGVELTITAEVVPRIRGSARDLVLLVRNLVDNAIRYTKAGGRVEVTLGRRRRRGRARRARHRPGDPPARSPPHLRAVLPGRPRALARDRRDRARPVDRAPHRREPRGADLGRVRARPRDEVRGAASGGARRTADRLRVAPGRAGGPGRLGLP